MEKNQRTIKGPDGVERVFTFAPLTRKEVNKAQFLTTGSAQIFASLGKADSGFTEHAFESSFWPLAKLVLRGVVIHNDSEIVEIADLDESDYFDGELPYLMAVVMEAADVLGFFRQMKEGSSTTATEKTTLKE